jgi:hypothetical protein
MHKEKSNTTMRKYDSPFATGAYNYLRSIYRSNDLSKRPAVNYDAETLFWSGVQGAWSNLSFLNCEAGQDWIGPVATDRDLTRELLAKGVSESSVRPFGAHTLVELDNISFVYRAKYYKVDGSHLLVAPHISGQPFGKCGHTFVHPFGPLQDFAETMVLFDRSVPEIRQACLDAVDDARKESAERAIKTRTAESLMDDIFTDGVPENVRFRVDGLRHPADLDILRIEVLRGGYFSHRVDVPLDLPRECCHYLPEMILEYPGEGLTRMLVDPFYDDEGAEWIPCLCNEQVMQGVR